MGRKKLEPENKASCVIRIGLTPSELEKWRGIVERLLKDTPKKTDSAAFRILLEKGI